VVDEKKTRPGMTLPGSVRSVLLSLLQCFDTAGWGTGTTSGPSYQLFPGCLPAKTKAGLLSQWPLK